jgi:hypothetical protein
MARYLAVEVVCAMAKPQQTPTDRSVLEKERGGDPSGEWATETGVFNRTLDIEYAETLSKGLSLADEANAPKKAPDEGACSLGAPESDPYNQVTATQPGSSARQKRRSLDDMRRLSEEIKAAKNWGTKS